jgi:hypothetical protein
MRIVSVSGILAALALSGCVDDAYRAWEAAHDAGGVDGALPDAGTSIDSGVSDAGDTDAGGADAGKPDAGNVPDAGQTDAGGSDGGCVGCTGCCDGLGQCQPGTSPTACRPANGSTCADCSANPTGHACLASAGCGCRGAGDCPSLESCGFNMAGVCTGNCDGNHACNSGCCNASGLCVAGNTTMECGPPGLMCQACSVGACFAGQCGCTGPPDCLALEACDTNAHLCSSNCDGGTVTFDCNTGCCGAGGSCLFGNVSMSCGTMGGVCQNCSMQALICQMGRCI